MSSCFQRQFINSWTVKLCTQKSVIKMKSFIPFTVINQLVSRFVSVKFVFFFLNFLVYMNFTLVARKWPQYVNHWERAEQKLLELHIMQHQNQQVQKKIRKIAIAIMFLALSKFPYNPTLIHATSSLQRIVYLHYTHYCIWEKKNVFLPSSFISLCLSIIYFVNCVMNNKHLHDL